MTPRTGKPRALSVDESRSDLVKRLYSRRAEAERAIMASVRQLAAGAHADDAEFLVGLRASVSATWDYLLTGIQRGEERAGPIPSVVLEQAQRAARNGVTAENALLQCAAGNRIVTGFVVAESGDLLGSDALAEVLDAQGVLLERLMTAIASEHQRELERARRSTDVWDAVIVRKILAGDRGDTVRLRYDLDGWHIGLIARGSSARELLRSIAGRSNRELLAVAHGEDTVWAWIGGKRRLSVAELAPVLSAQIRDGVSLALGEPGSGVDGWRLTHHQAQAADLVALHTGAAVTPYAGDMLLSAALQDDTLARSLTEIFLAPLTDQPDGGRVSLQTLRAYLSSGRNASSAASMLGVTRHTVESRVRAAEQRLGRRLDTSGAEVALALRLEALGDATDAV